MAYHGHCYIVPLEKDPFPHNLRTQETESLGEMEETKAIGWEVTEQENKELKEMFTSARPGNHFMTPFQCEVCQFRIIYGREPVQSSTPDGWALACMVRANIDAFWSRRPSTVKANLQEVNRIMGQANQLGIMSPMFGFDRGPFPLRDTMGMVPAILLLQRSLDRGKNSPTIQWDTMRGLWTAYSNLVHTTSTGYGGATMTDGKRSTFITNSPTNSLWFCRFMDGSHERM
ncbi:hypothetical protein ACA910_010187 [Epithemia clementina (nom. ined.)]